MDLQLKGKVILVTGGAKGIGAAIVRACSAEGAIPVIADRDARAGKELQAELHGDFACGFLATDLLSSGATIAVEQTVKKYGSLDGLVNNAGVNDRVGLESGNPEAFVESLKRNLVHYFAMAHYALPHLK